MGRDPHTAQEYHSPLATPCLSWFQTKSLDGLTPLVLSFLFPLGNTGNMSLRFRASAVPIREDVLPSRKRSKYNRCFLKRASCALNQMFYLSLIASFHSLPSASALFQIIRRIIRRGARAFIIENYL